MNGARRVDEEERSGKVDPFHPVGLLTGTEDDMLGGLCLNFEFPCLL